MGLAVERHMFEEMGESALVVGFGEAADVEAQADDDAVPGRAIVQQRIFHPARQHAEDHVRVRRQVAVRIVPGARGVGLRSEEHTSELQSLMRSSYAVFCLKKKST